MSWERGRPFAAVARRRAHTAVNQPPLAERWHNISKSADNSWLTSKLSVEKKESHARDARLVPDSKNAAHKFIYRKMRAIVKTDGARTTLCWLAALLLTPLIGVILNNSFQMAASGLLTEIIWPQAVWAISSALLCES